jgi:hypothetical protein
MKKLFLAIVLTLTGLPAFATGNYCESCTRTCKAKFVVCDPKGNAIENDRSHPQPPKKKYRVCSKIKVYGENGWVHVYHKTGIMKNKDFNVVQETVNTLNAGCSDF